MVSRLNWSLNGSWVSGSVGYGSNGSVANRLNWLLGGSLDSESAGHGSNLSVVTRLNGSVDYGPLGQWISGSSVKWFTTFGQVIWSRVGACDSL